MDADTKKTALRMIPYGIYVLTAGNEGSRRYRLPRRIEQLRPERNVSRPRIPRSSNGCEPAHFAQSG